LEITFIKVMPTPLASLRSPEARSSRTERIEEGLEGDVIEEVIEEEPPDTPDHCS
jgi:hypothetical protein